MSLAQKKALTLQAARDILAACEAEARKNQWRVVIAVVDDGGHPIVLARLDGTQWSSVSTAIGKARTAVAFRRPTRFLEDVINNGRTAFLTIPGDMVMLQGGVPIEVDGEIVGGIGVSGVKAADDEAVAMAGLAAVKG